MCCFIKGLERPAPGWASGLSFCPPAVLGLYWGCTGAVLEMYLGYTGGVPETYWSCSGIPGDLSASICLPHIVLLLQSAVVFDIITGTCDYQDLRNEGLNQKV